MFVSTMTHVKAGAFSLRERVREARVRVVRRMFGIRPHPAFGHPLPEVPEEGEGSCLVHVTVIANDSTEPSEVNLRCQLDHSRCYAANSTTDRAECSGLKIAVHRTGRGIEVVCQVENFRSQQKPALRFAQRNILTHGQIAINVSRQTNRAGARRCAPVSPPRGCKGCRIESSGPRTLASRQVGFLSCNAISSGWLSGAGRVYTVVNACRKTAASGQNCLNLPLVNEVSHPALRSGRRNIVQYGLD